VTPEEFVARLEVEIMGPAQFALDDLLAETGMDLAAAEELWLGLGFPLSRSQELRFTEADVAVLHSVLDLQAQGYAGPDVVVPMTRVLGQALARVAQAQAEVFRTPLLDALAVDDAEPGAIDELTLVTDRLIDRFETYVTYVWRRQLMAAIRRELLDEGSEVEVVGFVDLVDYTRETRDLGDAELSEVLARFQRMVYDQVTSQGGRVVKVIGDGAMFTAHDPRAAAAAGLGLVDAAARDERLRGVRVGLATGPVVPLEGDLYGSTVNRASRLSDHAYAGTVLVDDETGRALEADPALRLRRTKPQRLKGLGTEQTWVVRPSHDPRDRG
jgi:adenylate cyclase